MMVGTTVQTISAMLLPWVWGGERDVVRLASVADDGPDDQPLDEEEDRGRDDEDDRVQVADPGALLGHCLGRVETGDERLAVLDDIHAEDERDDHGEDQKRADDQSEERGLRGARPGGTRHQGPQGATHQDGATTVVSAGAVDSRSVEPAPFYMGTPVTRVRRGLVRACRVVLRDLGGRSWEDAG